MVGLEGQAGAQTADKTPQTERQGPAAPAITAAMLNAGSHVVAEQWGVIGDDVAPDLARDVFLAMWAAQKDQEPSLSSS